MYIKSTYDGLHVITGTTENVSAYLLNVKAIVCLYTNTGVRSDLANGLQSTILLIRTLWISGTEAAHVFTVFTEHLCVLDWLDKNKV